MRSPSTSRQTWRAGRLVLQATVLCALAWTWTGCGPQLGAIIYYLNLTPKQTVSAEFKLPPGPILILVDDDQELVKPPLAREALVDALATQLREHKLTERVTTNEEVGLIRGSVADFDKLSVREVGRRANADTVIWMNVEDFFIEKDLEMLVTPARFGVILKVFNAREENKAKIRLWPSTPAGRSVNITMSPHDVRKCKSHAEVHQLLAAQLASEAAKLFYEYKVEKQ